MKSVLTCAIFAAISMTVSNSLIAQTKTPGELPAAFIDAWNSHSQAKFEKIFADDVAFLPYPELFITDRKAVVDGFGLLVTKEWAKDVNTKLSGKVTVQQLGPATASVFFRTQLVDPKTGNELDPGDERANIFVSVKGKTGWRIASMQLTKENPDAPLSRNDESEIKNLILSVQNAMNAPDLDSFNSAYNKLFTENADWINVAGLHWQGKKIILKEQGTYFNTVYKNSRWSFTDVSTRQIGFRTALVVVTEHPIEITPHSSGVTVPQVRNNILSFVVVKQEGKWLISHAHNTLVN